jgi:hypothetical protein
MLRRVRDALRDLSGELVDRAFPLSKHVNDLSASPVPERTRYRGLSVEQGCFRGAARHDFASYQVNS